MANLNEYNCLKSHKGRIFRLTWLFLYVILLGLIIFLLVMMFNGFVNNPTLTSLKSFTFSVESVAFPGISICNINKISKRRTMNLAADIANITGGDFEKMFKYAGLVGNLYDFEYDKSFSLELEEFQNVLDDLEIDVIALTRRLSTPCDELITSCSWKGESRDCNELFKLRLSHDGYCCMFNYVKNMSDLLGAEILKDPLRGVPGIENGLSLVINNDLEDYHYCTFSSIGVMAQVFVPTDYPDKHSGGLSEIICTTGHECFLEVLPTTVEAVSEVMNYPAAKRNCLFDIERPTEFKDIYSQSDCFVDCRIKSTLALCKCIPFLIPLSDKETVCVLTDLFCLNKHKSKWHSVAPRDLEVEAPQVKHLEMESQESLRCDEICYASCSDTLYNVVANLVPARSLPNNSIIHIFYNSRSINFFVQDVVYYWFEWLSSLGGICGLVIGSSIISLIEVLLYICQYTKKRVNDK